MNANARIAFAKSLLAGPFQMTRLRITLWLCLITFLHVHGEDPQLRFDIANKAYEQGQYDQAAKAYESMLDDRLASAAVYFNLGNTYFQAGRRGEAIHAYLQAQRLDPRDPAIAKSLSFARLGVTGIKSSSAASWINQVSLDEWAILNSLALTGLCLAGSLAVWQTKLRSKLKPLLLGCAIGLGLTALGTISTSRQLWSDNIAVIITGSAPVRYGPLSESDVNYQLPDGSEITILDTKDGWHQIADRNGREGWLLEEHTLRLTSP